MSKEFDEFMDSVKEQKEPKQYPIGGYAPGYYRCTCVTCKTEFMGDKRAVQCEPCAIEMTKEEPKQEEDEIIDISDHDRIGNAVDNLNDELPQETLEEAAEKYSLKAAQTFAVDKFTKNSNPKEGRVNWDSILEVLKIGVLAGHKFGAKWQAERMYSEEDMKNAIEKTIQQCNKMMQESYGLLEIDVDYIFEQFKKK